MSHRKGQFDPFFDTDRYNKKVWIKHSPYQSMSMFQLKSVDIYRIIIFVTNQ